ncbi:DNA polymerase IV [Roseovarius gaetbuli]|uniref:DNA-directed DNA polymerase n=1 Tax=Roseovarius gaetbuli TaxID=1356575 RepID=A0A1X6ZE92_9RHOB|nr:DNA polymerase Y family protein [Roseovarius gaetbuli]SLN48865.1 DNA polymerase IV [Roseovarius gaetbuli]
MSARRILSVWFPRLGAERLLRRAGDMGDLPFAVVGDAGQSQVLVSLSHRAEAAGLSPGQPLRDARALCAALVTEPQNRPAEAAFLRGLCRWAGRFSPWVGLQGEAGLVLDITGCTHLFGGEAAMMEGLAQGAVDLGLSARCGLADTVGAAWALARFAGEGGQAIRSGDAIDQEARATRSRAAKRRSWERGGAAPVVRPAGAVGQIAPPGQMRGALAPLPVAALRLPQDMVQELGRLGLRRIGDLSGQPRGPLARRFGPELLLRLDQAVGLVPEQVSPLMPTQAFATRLSLPEPIGLQDDLRAGLDRLADRLCALLRDRGHGARRVRFEVFRVDGTVQAVQVGLARPADTAQGILPLLAMKLDEIEAGFGIDMLRLEAVETERIEATQMAGHVTALGAAERRQSQACAIEDLMGRLGARIGLEAITRRHPGSSHVPEKSAQVLAAAWSGPAPGAWPTPAIKRPLLIWRPEPVRAPETPHLKERFHWRGRSHEVVCATGPERIAPEWWLDDPEWRSGVRDYWWVVTARGEELWLYYAYGAALSPGWFCQGRFA